VTRKPPVTHKLQGVFACVMVGVTGWVTEGWRLQVTVGMRVGSGLSWL